MLFFEYDRFEDCDIIVWDCFDGLCCEFLWMLVMFEVIEEYWWLFLGQYSERFEWLLIYFC